MKKFDTLINCIELIKVSLNFLEELQATKGLWSIMKNKMSYFNIVIFVLIVIGLIVTYNTKQDTGISTQSNPPTFSQ